MRKSNRIILSILFSLLGAGIAIIIHALMPSPGADVTDTPYNSILVNTLGFPVVASLFLIVQYTYILFVIRFGGRNTNISKTQIGLRFGLAIGLLYMIGMQEVVVESSPFAVYGIDFIAYQFFMGLGDAIPILAFSLVSGVVFLNHRTNNNDSPSNKLSKKKILLGILLISMLLFAIRMCGNVTGIIGSDIEHYPAPTMIWTLAFGVTMGGIYFLIRPIFAHTNHALSKNVILSIGLNWIWFNSMIILLMADTAGEMLFRSTADITTLYIGALLFEKLIAGKAMPQNPDSY